MQPVIEWVIEASTFCNLRCSYCYQWDGLADRRRMPLELWRKVLEAACDYHRLQEDRSGGPVSTRLIWHGGEPLTLPLDYLQSTFELKEQVVAAAGLTPEQVTTSMQTNLYALPEPAIGLLQRHRVGFGVSFDVVRGLRLTTRGGTSEDRVLANLERLRTAGLGHGAITVLARHTSGMICDVFDFWAERGLSFRVLPLFAGPDTRDAGRFAVDEDTLVDALCRLFRHWMASSRPIVVAPLDQWLSNVVRHLLGIGTPDYDRRRNGESVLVVRPDGQLHQVADLGAEASALGDLGRQTIGEIVESDAYRASLGRSDEVTRRTCTGCRYRAACDTWPAHSAPREPIGSGGGERCHVTHRVHGYIERYLRQARFDEAQLRALAEQVLAAPRDGMVPAHA